MEEEEEEIERNMNNITCNTSFPSLIAMNVQNKDTNWSLDRRLDSGVLVQSTISNSVHIDSDKQVVEINDSEEQVDIKNWLRNDSTKQVDQINDTKKQVDATINDSDK